MDTGTCEMNILEKPDTRASLYGTLISA